jgi:predicted lipoprotein with Yx(FWY)xxD motif
MKFVPRSIAFAFASTICLALAGFSLAQAVAPAVQVRYDPAVGHILTGPNGMSLYVFGNDEPSKSNCYDQCAVNWPPLLIETDQALVSPLAIPGEFGVSERTDGGRQVTYNGWPLYYWVRDQNVGDTTGQSVGDVWWVANINPVVRLLEHPRHGNILVGPTGMTLYRFTNDADGVSNCAGGCAMRWPPLVGGFNRSAGVAPLTGEGVSGEIGIIERDDAGMQVTFDGEPLYYWVNDHAPGDTTGHEVGGVWFVVTH